MGLAAIGERSKEGGNSLFRGQYARAGRYNFCSLCYPARSTEMECSLANGRSWGPDDMAELRRLVGSGMTDAQIGERMGRGRSFISRKRRDHQIEPGLSRGHKAVLARVNLRRMLCRYDRMDEE